MSWRSSYSNHFGMAIGNLSSWAKVKDFARSSGRTKNQGTGIINCTKVFTATSRAVPFTSLVWANYDSTLPRFSKKSHWYQSCKHRARKLARRCWNSWDGDVFVVGLWHVCENLWPLQQPIRPIVVALLLVASGYVTNTCVYMRLILIGKAGWMTHMFRLKIAKCWGTNINPRVGI